MSNLANKIVQQRGGFGPLGNSNVSSRTSPSYSKFRMLHKQLDAGEIRDFSQTQWSQLSSEDRLQIIEDLEQEVKNLDHLFGKKVAFAPKPEPKPVTEPAGWGDW